MAPEELQKVQQKQVYGLNRSKAFYDARFQKKWLIIIDGTQTYSRISMPAVMMPQEIRDKAVQ